MKKARTYPMGLWQRSKRQKARVKREQLLLRNRHNRCRNAFGYRLRLTTATRKAFRHLKAAKQRRSFTKRLNALLMAMRDDLWQCPHERSTQYERECGCKSQSWHKLTNPPAGILGIREGSSLLGEWQAYPAQISIQWKGKRINETVIHECVHYIDYLSDISQDKCIGSHSKEFYKRCLDLAKMLGHKEKVGY